MSTELLGLWAPSSKNGHNDSATALGSCHLDSTGPQLSRTLKPITPTTVYAALKPQTLIPKL